MYCLHVGLCTHVVQCCRGQKRVLDYSELKFSWNWNYRLFSSAVWVLGIKPGSSARALSALHHYNISPAPIYLFFNIHFAQDCQI